MKHYSKEVKEKCIQLRTEGRTISSITEEYNLGAGTLRYWMKDYYENEKPGKQEEDAKYRALLKEHEELKKELDFVKKAASYFASYPKK